MSTQRKVKNSKFTKGNWVRLDTKTSPRICIDGNPECPIVLKSGGPNYAQIKANEFLIAAAPDLFEALVTAIEYMENKRHVHVAAFQMDLAKMNDAIKKAQGELWADDTGALSCDPPSEGDPI